MKPILNVIRPLPPTASAFSTTMMKKSSSFSFSSLAAAAATGSNSNKNPPPATIDLAKLTSQLKGTTTKKSTDDSFRRWEEQRAKKLEALNINTKTGKRKTTATTNAAATAKVEEKSTAVPQPKKEEKPKAPSFVPQQPKKEYERQPLVVKYNHQETIQPPPLKPRNPQQATSATSHKSSSSSSTRRERATATAAAKTTTTTAPRRPKISLHPNWYTENIYTNQSMDDSDGDSSIHKRPLTTSASFSHYNTRSSRRHNQWRNSFHNYDFNGNNRTNNININISNTANTKLHGYSSSFEDDGFDMDGQPYFERHRNYPKSHSCSFAERQRERAVIDARSRSVPKSHSFTGTNRSHMAHQYDMDLIEYQRYKRMMKAQRQQQASTSGYFGPSTSHPPHSSEPIVMRICDREGCFSETCLVKNVNNSQNISINNNIINNNNINTSHIINEWDMRNKNSNFRDRNDPRRNLPPRETFLDDVETFDDDDFIFNDGFSFQEFPCQPARPNQRHPRSHYNPYFSSMCCAPGFPDQFHRRTRVYDRDLDDLFRRERSKVLIRNKFDKLNKYSDEFTDDYQKSFEDLFHEGKGTVHGHNLKPSKTMLEVKAPNKYDDTESDSTDMELDDFNVDFEKYWEDLEDKNLSTSSTLELADENFDDNNNHVDGKSTDQDMDHSNTESDANNNPVNFNDFYKPMKYSPVNSKRLDYFQKILPPKKINILSTARPLGLITANDHNVESGPSTKRPLTLSNIIESPVHDTNASFTYNPCDESMEHPKFEIIPKKTGLKISPLYNFEFDNCHNSIINNNSCKLKSTARPLIFW